MNKEKPILFSAEMVRLILSGDKTQTRRAVKIPSWTWDKHEDLKFENGELLAMSRKMGYRKPIAPPYAVGDVLWVRETYATFEGAMGAGFIYKADSVHNPPVELCIPDRWKPAIHMTRKAARIFLRVKSIRPERLQDISIDDARAECDSSIFNHSKTIAQLTTGHVRTKNAYIADFAGLWDYLNAERGLGWSVNPWVWVVEFAIKSEEVQHG